MSFRPSLHGFAFANEFEYPGHVLGLGGHVSAEHGLGAGMCWAALDRWLAGRAVPGIPDAPAAGNPLHLELLQRQANAFARIGAQRLLAWQCMPETASVRSFGIAARSRHEWRRVRASLDAGMPILLVLVRGDSVYADPSSNAAVLAYRYERDRRARRVSVWVYDPRRPGHDSIRLTFKLGVPLAPLDASVAAQDKVRGFFAVPYDRAAPAPLRLERVPGDEAEAGFEPVLVEAESRRVRALLRYPNGAFACVERRAGTWRLREVAAADWSRLDAEARPVRVAGRIVARSQRGELVELRTGGIFGARVLPLTIRRHAGRRADGGLASDGRAAFYVRGGALLRLSRKPFAGWREENPGTTDGTLRVHRATGTPSVVSLRGAAHVLVRTEQGHLLHAWCDRKNVWRAVVVTARFAEADGFRAVEDPLALPAADGGIDVLARNAARELLHFRWSARGGWRAANVAQDCPVRGAQLDPTAPVTPVAAGGALHLLGRSRAGGLLHFRCGADAEWRGEDVCARGAIGDAFHLDYAPAAARGAGAALHTLGSRNGDALLFRWTTDAGWTAENATRERGGIVALAGAVALARAADDSLHALAAAPGGGLSYVRIGAAPRAEALRDAVERAWLGFERALLQVVRGVPLPQRRGAADVQLETLLALPAEAVAEPAAFQEAAAEDAPFAPAFAADVEAEAPRAEPEAEPVADFAEIVESEPAATDFAETAEPEPEPATGGLLDWPPAESDVAAVWHEPELQPVVQAQDPEPAEDAENAEAPVAAESALLDLDAAFAQPPAMAFDETGAAVRTDGADVEDEENAFDIRPAMDLDAALNALFNADSAAVADPLADVPPGVTEEEAAAANAETMPEPEEQPAAPAADVASEPEEEPALPAAGVASEPEEEPVLPADVALEPEEPVLVTADVAPAPATQVVRRKARRLSPALEGLPLLDENADDIVPQRHTVARPEPKPPRQQPRPERAATVAEKKKQPEKERLREVIRILELADEVTAVEPAKRRRDFWPED